MGQIYYGETVLLLQNMSARKGIDPVSSPAIQYIDRIEHLDEENNELGVCA